MANDKRFINVEEDKKSFSYKISQLDFNESTKDKINFFNKDVVLKGSPLSESDFLDAHLPEKIQSETFILSLKMSLSNLNKSEHEELKNNEKKIREKYSELRKNIEKELKLRECFVFIEEHGWKAVKQQISEESQSSSCSEWPSQFLP